MKMITTEGTGKLCGDDEKVFASGVRSRGAPSVSKGLNMKAREYWDRRPLTERSWDSGWKGTGEP